MGKKTGIEWTDHTFNPWWGCTKVSPGCANCYAERDANRYGHAVWGPAAPRRFFGHEHWTGPLKWDLRAMKEGVRRRVFCASMADLYENPGPDHEELAARMDRERLRLYEIIKATPRLEWLLLTKRPEEIGAMAPPDTLPGDWSRYPNVRVGVSVESGEYLSRVKTLLESGAPHPWVSYEPALGPISLHRYFSICENDNCPHTLYDCRTGDTMIEWVVVGGESGPGARPCDLAWIRSIRDQCLAAGVACFVKQVGAYPVGDRIHLSALNAPRHDRKGGDPSEWPEDLRVREFPRC